MRHVCALALACTTTLASAQGIPVIDAANLAQTVQQVVHAITQIDNQIRQITQLQSQLDSISGVRNLGRVFDNPLLRNYVPAQAFTVLNAVDAAGYGSLSTTAKALRDAVMVYNCGDLPDGAARNQCQAALAQPYQHKGLLQDAMRTAAGRLAQIDALMAQVDATDDQKATMRRRCWTCALSPSRKTDFFSSTCSLSRRFSSTSRRRSRPRRTTSLRRSEVKGFSMKS